MITRDKSFYKSIITLALPIACQNLINFAVNLADSVMIGRIAENSEKHIVAVSFANQLFFIFMILLFGLGSGANILLSQYWGKKDLKAIRKIMAIAYKVAVVFAIVFMLIAALVPEWFMSIFSNDPEVIRLGSEYLQIIFISYIFFAITSVSISALRSVEIVNISIIVYGISLLVNVFFNYSLIYGRFGMPALGVRGAAIATTIARIVEFLIVLFFMVFFEKRIDLKVKDLLTWDGTLFKDFTRIGFPVLCNELLWVMGSSVLVWIISLMGTEVATANNITNTAWQFVSVFFMGAGNASSVIIGRTIGAEQYHKIKEYSMTLILIAFVLGLAGGFMMFLLRPYIIRIYNISDYTYNLTMDVMAVSSLIIVFQSLAFMLLVGILRGGGDTKFVFYADLIFLCGIAIPLGYIVAIVLKAPVPLAFLALKSDEVIKVIFGIFRVKGNKWVRNVTRETKE